MAGHNSIRAAALLALLLTCQLSASADTLTIPNTFVPLTQIKSATMNANFNAIQTWSSNITNVNIKSGAAIAPSKLDFTLEIGPILRGAASDCFAAGTTGDTVPRFKVDSGGIIYLGAGGASAVDCSIVRNGSASIKFRDGTNAADADIYAKIGTFSSSVLATALGLTNTNTLTMTPAAMGGSRAVTVTDPGGSCKLYFGNSSLTTDGVMYYDGSTLSSTGAGTSPQVLTSNGPGVAPTFQTLPARTNGFGGDGSAGAITYSSSTTDVWTQTNATTIATSGTPTRGCNRCLYQATSTITIGNGAVFTADTYGGFAGTGVFSASTNGFNGNNGGEFAPGANNWIAQSPGGQGSVSGGVGAGGGGGGGGGPVGGIGGDGGGASPANGGFGGSANYLDVIGAGGGSAGTGAGAQSGDAGFGGGCMRFYAVGAIALNAGSSVKSKGSVGTAGSTLAGGSGGGGGGMIFFLSQTSAALGAGLVDVSGGNGGNAAGANADGGAGGGGGSVYQMSPSNTGTVTANGGTGGTQGAGGTVGGNGSAGALLAITGTPNLPTVAMVEDMRGFMPITLAIDIKRFKGTFTGEERLTQDQQSVAFASVYAKPGKFEDLRFCLNNGASKDEAMACVRDDMRDRMSKAFDKVQSIPEAMKMCRSASQVSRVAVGDTIDARNDII